VSPALAPLSERESGRELSGSFYTISEPLVRDKNVGDRKCSPSVRKGETFVQVNDSLAGL
jgi:hypothetical protein